jgi:hypothetical protein
VEQFERNEAREREADRLADPEQTQKINVLDKVQFEQRAARAEKIERENDDHHAHESTREECERAEWR